MSRGACQSEDPELFFPITGTGAAQQQIGAAKAVCLRCAVRAPCMSYALATSPDGIWGGTTPDERLRARKSLPAACPPKGRIAQGRTAFGSPF
jgi:WhiB family redox-sensing transcriptional regulator